MFAKNNPKNRDAPLNTVAKDGSSRINLGRTLFILVDDLKRAEIDLRKTNAVSFDMNAHDKEIKIIADDKTGKMFVERFPLDFSNLDGKGTSETFQLKTGQKTTFNFLPIVNEDKRLAKVVCQLIYDDPQYRLGASGSSGNAAKSFVSRSLAQGIAAACVLVLLTGGFGWFMYQRFKENKIETAENQLPTKTNAAKLPESSQRQESGNANEITISRESKTKLNQPLKGNNVVENSASSISKTRAHNENKSVYNNRKSFASSSRIVKNRVTATQPIVIANLTDKLAKERQTNVERLAVKRNFVTTISNNTIAKNIIKAKVVDVATKVKNDNVKTIARNTVASGVSEDVKGKSLLEIKQVYLDWQGDLKLGTQINGRVIDEIQKSGLLGVTDKKAADAALKIDVKRDIETLGENNSKPKVKVSMWLINNKGTIVTPNTKGDSDWKYVGELEKLPTQIVKDVKMLTTPQK